MNTVPIIKKIKLTRFKLPLNDIGYDVSFGQGVFYEPGSLTYTSPLAIQIYTDEGITGEYITGTPSVLEQIQILGPFLIGKNALEREYIYNNAKSILRKHDRMGIGPIDVTLWDIAGKYFDAPIYQLLGGYRKKLPCYASTAHGDRTKGGLDSPEAYGDFAEQCLELGFKGFKIHSWAQVDLNKEIKTVHEVGRRVGGKMALMTDPCCVYDTFADALAVGRACDEENFFWYEDPMRDGGVSHYFHWQLRKMLNTPLLQGEHVHLVEAQSDMAAAEATDFWRADPDYDGGITGVMKIAHAAEGYGMDLELHVGGPAQRHCMAAIRNSNFYELGLVHPKLESTRFNYFKCGYQDNLTSIDKDGCVTVPEGPGLGVEYDFKLLEKYKVEEIIIK